MKINFVQELLSSIFKSYGEIIGRRPFIFITLPFILASILAIGMINIKFNRDVDYLFVAENGRAVENRKLVEDLFPINTSVFTDFPRFTRTPEGIIIFILKKNGSDMLHLNVLAEINMLDKMIRNVTLNINGEVHTYNELCGKIYMRCNDNPILKLIPQSEKLVSRKFRIKYPVDVDDLTFSYEPYAYNLGGITTDENGNVAKVQAVRLFYILDSNVEDKNWLKEWEKLVMDKITMSEFSDIKVYAIPLSLIRDQLEILSKNLYPLIAIVVTTIILFSMISSMTNDLVKSKPWLGMSSCISAGLAIAASFGLASILRIENIDINIILPFLVLGIEVDDSYVLIASWRSTNSFESVEKRMGETFAKASISITITSLTNLVASVIGIFAPFPVVRIFCIYASFCILFTYLYQLTFFGGCMAFSGYWEYKGINSIFLCSKRRFSGNNRESEETIMKMFRRKFAKFLSKSWVNTLVLLIFFSKLGFGLWGLNYLEDGLDTTKILSPDSVQTKAAKIYFKYFTDYPFTIQVIINKTLNYADEKVQQSLEKLIKKFESHPHIAEPELTLSWLKFYKLFIDNKISRFSMSGFNISAKQGFIDGLSLVFLRFKLANQFQYDIVFNENYTDILASRFLFSAKNVRDRKTEMKLLKDMWKIEDESDIPIKIHCVIADIIEQGIIINDIVFQSVLVASIVIIIVFFLCVPNPICLFIVALTVITTMLETIGFMALWKVNLDMISLIVLLLCVGFSINYPIHVSYAFATSPKITPFEKLSYSLYQIGYPIVQGSVSTIVGILVLAFSEFYIFVAFFKIVLLVSLLTCFKALLVIPIVLFIIENFKVKLSEKYRTKIVSIEI